MGFRAVGRVVAVEPGQYPDKNTGEIVQVFDAWLESADPRYAADKYSGPRELMPKIGEHVNVPVRLISGTSKGRGWLIVTQVRESDAAHKAA